MMDTPELSMAFTIRGGGPRVETIPVDSTGLIRLTKQLALNSVVAQLQSRSTTSLNMNAENKTNVAPAEEGTRDQ